MAYVADVPIDQLQGKRSPKYPWDEWADGRTWILTQDEDFTNPMESFRTLVYIEAKARGVYAQTKLVSDTQIAVQFYGRRK